MAEGFYAETVKDMQGRMGLSWTTDYSWKALLVKDTYTPNFVTHHYLADIDAGDRLGMSAALTGLTIVSRVADAADTSITTTAGSTAQAVVLVADTGDPATSPILLYLSDTLQGVPFTTVNGSESIVWASDGIFEI